MKRIFEEETYLHTNVYFIYIALLWVTNDFYFGKTADQGEIPPPKTYWGSIYVRWMVTGDIG